MRTIFKDGTKAFCDDNQLNLMLQRGWSTENGSSKSSSEKGPSISSEEGAGQEVERVLVKRTVTSNDAPNPPRVSRPGSISKQPSNATTVRRVAR